LIIQFIFRKLTGKQVIGMGDLKFLFVTGMYFSFYIIRYALLVSCVSSLFYCCICGKKRIPFGPFLCFGYTLIMMIQAI
ncbi:MAG: prepilin peptidase, partial [Erysipelotrichaceae bacterium]|nr:prepilin peptidase [Erysipelotrichaceae bacterium]